MRIYKRAQLLALIETIKKANKVLGKLLKQKDLENSKMILQQSQESAIELGKIMEEETGYTHIISLLEEYCEHVYVCYEAIPIRYDQVDEQIKKFNRILNKIHREIDLIPKDKLKILFIPYKASMWTSFESIWIAAKKDEQSNVSVMPIPYFELLDGEKKKEVFEKELFPSSVETIHYLSYDLGKEHPDIIFIHNPYDETNILTRVDSKYYSKNLREHTECLIYSPYHTVGSYTKGKMDSFYTSPGNIYSDYCICQSEKVRDIYVSLGFPKEKFILQGSPKIDAVINKMPEKEMPSEWKEKLTGRKVFLLNTNLLYFYQSFCNTSKSGDFAKRFHDEIMQAIVNKKDRALIWRPHPLMYAMLEKKCPECLVYVNKLKATIEESDNCVMDMRPEYLTAFKYSDAMISTWSSLINEYMITKKPIQIFQKAPSADNCLKAPLNRGVCYFRFGENSYSFDMFMQMVQDEEDPKKEERINAYKSAFSILDGTAGERIYKQLYKRYGE